MANGAEQRPEPGPALEAQPAVTPPVNGAEIAAGGKGTAGASLPSPKQQKYDEDVRVRLSSYSWAGSAMLAFIALDGVAIYTNSNQVQVITTACVAIVTAAVGFFAGKKTR